MLNIICHQGNASENRNEIALAPTRIAGTEKTTVSVVRMWRTRNLTCCWWECNNGAATLENSLAVPKKLIVKLLYDLATPSHIPLLAVYPREPKTCL